MIILLEDAAGLAAIVAKGPDAATEIGAMAGQKKDQLVMRCNEGKAAFILTGKGWKISAKLTGSRYWPGEALNRL